MGVEIVARNARVAGPTSVVVKTADGDRALSTRYVLLCTGSRPAVPQVEGLEDVGYVTSESLFELATRPRAS